MTDTSILIKIFSFVFLISILIAYFSYEIIGSSENDPLIIGDFRKENKTSFYNYSCNLPENMVILSGELDCTENGITAVNDDLVLLFLSLDINNNTIKTFEKSFIIYNPDNKAYYFIIKYEKKIFDLYESERSLYFTQNNIQLVRTERKLGINTTTIEKEFSYSDIKEFTNPTIKIKYINSERSPFVAQYLITLYVNNRILYESTSEEIYDYTPDKYYAGIRIPKNVYFVEYKEKENVKSDFSLTNYVSFILSLIFWNLPDSLFTSEFDYLIFTILNVIFIKIPLIIGVGYILVRLIPFVGD